MIPKFNGQALLLLVLSFLLNAACSTSSDLTPVNEWLFGNIAGIKVGHAGYRTFSVKPEIANAGINYAEATYHSVNGKIVSLWKKEGNKIIMQVIVPVNTKARIFVPAKGQEKVTAGEAPLKSSSFLKILGFKDGYLELEAGSGDFLFLSEIQ